MHVRLVKPEDRAEWLRLLLGLYPHHPEPEHAPVVDAFFAGSPHPELLPAAVFVCERPDGGLGGFLELSVRNYAEGCTGPTPFVESWYVDADVRGRGVGGALVAAAEEWARSQGYAELASNADLENHGSQRAHGAVGFEEVERTVHYRKAL